MIEPAILHVRHELEAFPESHQAYNTMGLIYAKLKKYDQALVSFDRALSINKDFELARSNRESILRHQEKLRSEELRDVADGEAP